VKRPPERAYGKLLAAVDFSAPSESALRIALRLAPRAAVLAAHAYDVPFEEQLRVAGVSEETIEAYRVRAEQRTIAAIQVLGDNVAGERSRLVHAVDRGNPSRLILEKEQALQPDLTVMGKRQRPAAEQLLLGSVARHVLANCRSDVLIAPV
jgi:nucleotide-binding universal stress UspA family protein